MHINGKLNRGEAAPYPAGETPALPLLAQHLDHQPLSPAAVELDVEDRLPRAEVQATVGDRDDHLVVDEQVRPPIEG